MPNFRMSAAKDTAELMLYDIIGADWFGGIGSKEVVSAINALPSTIKTLNVRINSPGGDVFEGNAIYNALTRFNGRVEVDIDAEAASIASIIAMAGDEIRMAENAWMMIHDPYSGVLGTSDDMRKQADILDGVRDGLIATYAKRTGQKPDQITTWMHDETWLNAEDAVRYGFADATSQPLKIAACKNAPWFKNAPRNLIEQKSPLLDMRLARLKRMENRHGA